MPCGVLLQITPMNVVFLRHGTQQSKQYASDSDDDLLHRFAERPERGVGDWTAMSASWTTKTSTDERHSALPPSGLRALYEVLYTW